MLGGLWNYIKKLFSGKSRRRQRLEKRQEDVARRVRTRQSGGTYLQRAFKTKRWKQTQVQGGQPPVWPDPKAAGPPVEKNTPQEALERRVAPTESPDVFTPTPAPEATREPPADTGGHVVEPKAFLDDEGNETGQIVPPEGTEADSNEAILRRHQSGDWDDSQGFPEVHGMAAAANEAAPRRAPAPGSTSQQVPSRLLEAAQTPTPQTLETGSAWRASSDPVAANGNQDKLVQLQEEMVKLLQSIEEKLDMTARWN